MVKPTWATFRAKPGDCVIELDPGMSFGTGRHASTWLCLRFLDSITGSWAPNAVLDAGCGSGILSIAAARLGARSVTALDNDPVAVRIAAANFALNGVGDRCRARAGDVMTLPRGPRYDLVMANILSGVLEACAQRLVAVLARRESSRLVLSGILTGQYGPVRDRYLALGMREVESLTGGEWTSGCFAPVPGFGLSPGRPLKSLPRTVSNAEDVKQLVRASGSVAANYIEANEALSKKDFVI